MLHKMIAIIFIALAFQGCQNSGTTMPFSTATVASGVLPTAGFDLDYYKFNRIFLLTYPNGELKVILTSRSRNQVYIVEGTEIRELAFSAPTDCTYPSYLAFQDAGDNRVLSLLKCSGYFEGVAPGYKADAVFVVEVFFDSGEVRQVFDDQVIPSLRYEYLNFDIDKKRGVITAYSMWTILELLPDSIKPIDLDLNSTSGSWNLKDPFLTDDANLESHLWGQAGYESLQITTGRVAFLATFDPIGKSGIRRFNGNRYQVMVIDEEHRLIHEGSVYISDPGRLEWNPIKDEVLIAGSAFGISGLWIYNISNSQFTLIDRGEFKAPSWNTAGDVAYGLKCTTWDDKGFCERVEIVEYRFD